MFEDREIAPRSHRDRRVQYQRLVSLRVSHLQNILSRFVEMAPNGEVRGMVYKRYM